MGGKSGQTFRKGHVFLPKYTPSRCKKFKNVCLLSIQEDFLEVSVYLPFGIDMETMSMPFFLLSMTDVFPTLPFIVLTMSFFLLSMPNVFLTLPFIALMMSFVLLSMPNVFPTLPFIALTMSFVLLSMPNAFPVMSFYPLTMSFVLLTMLNILPSKADVSLKELVGQSRGIGAVNGLRIY